MKKGLKRIITAFSAAVIIVTGMPAEAFASETVVDEEVQSDVVWEDSESYELDDTEPDGTGGFTQFTKDMQQDWEWAVSTQKTMKFFRYNGSSKSVRVYEKYEFPAAPEKEGDEDWLNYFNTHEWNYEKDKDGNPVRTSVKCPYDLRTMLTNPTNDKRWEEEDGRFLPGDIESFEAEDGVYTQGDFDYMFADCAKLKKVDISPILHVTTETGYEISPVSLSHTFYNCKSLEEVKFWNDKTDVNSIQSMFEGCSSLKEADLSKLDLSGVRDGRTLNFYDAFKGTTSLEKIETPINAPAGIGLANTYKGSDGKTYTELPAGLSSSITLTKIRDKVRPASITFISDPMRDVPEGNPLPQGLTFMIKPYYANDINLSLDYEGAIIYVDEENYQDNVIYPEDADEAVSPDVASGYIARIYQGKALKRGNTTIKAKDTVAGLPEISLPVSVVRASGDPNKTPYDSVLLKGWKEDVSEALRKNEWDGTGKLVSTNTKVATVDNKGVVTAKGVGEAEIHWIIGDDEINTEVLVKVQLPKIAQKTVTLTYQGQETDALSNYEDCDMDPFSVESAKTDIVAPVEDSPGTFVAKKAGTSKITFTWKSNNPKITGKTVLSYSVKVSSISISKSSLTILTGANATLNLKGVTKDMNVVWCVDGDQDIMDEKGYSNPYLSLTPKAGKCTVNALLPCEKTVVAVVDGARYECVITVPVPEVKKPELTMAKGKSDTFALNPKTTKLKITSFKSWKSNDDSVAKVVYDAKKKKYTIEAVDKGSCAIYADMGEVGYYLIHVKVTGEKKADVDVPIDAAAGFSDQLVQSSASDVTTIGNTATDGLSLAVGSGTFKKDVRISTKPMDKDKLKKIGAFEDGILDKIISPVEIECEATDGTKYNGEDLGTNTVILTMPIPENDPSQIPYYMFVYFNEETGEMEYYYPDSYDLTNMTMSVSVPHFSAHGAVKAKQQAAVDKYLNDYSMRVALEKLQQKEAQKILQPYLKKKAVDLGLTVGALEDLLQNTVNWAGGNFNGPAKGRIAAETKLASGLLRAYIDARDDNGALNPSKIDPEAVEGAFNDFIVEGMSQTWEGLEYDKKIVNGVEIIDENKTVPNEAIGWTINNANNVSKMLGAFSGGDKEEGFKALGDIMKNSNRTVEFVTDMVHLTARSVNLTFTYWKSAQVDKLYDVYKKGNKYVSPGNWEEFQEYLDYAPGLCNAKGLNRFYEMDKMKEYWDAVKDSKTFKAYSATEYDDLPDSVKGQLEKMAEKALKDYFEMRKNQENEAEKIKAEEKKVMETLLQPGGALEPVIGSDPLSVSIGRTFGEKDADHYNAEERLKCISNIRNQLETYVNVDKLRDLSKIDSFNMGDMINSWVLLTGQIDMETGGALTNAELNEKVKEKFCEEWSKVEGIIKDEFKSYVAVESVSIYKSAGLNIDYITSLNMAAGDSEILEASVYPSTATVQGVKWTSSNPDVVYVHQKGKGPESSKVAYITAFKAGTSVITATSKSGAISGSVTVTVTADDAEDPTSSQYMADIVKGLKVNVESQAYEAFDKVLQMPPSLFKNPKSKYVAKNTKVASMSGFIVTGKGAGTSDINWKYNAGHGTGWDKKLGTVRVQEPKVNNSIITLSVGQGASGKGNIKNCTIKPTKWVSKNPNVATVNENGIIIGKKRGTTTIYAVYEGTLNTVSFNFKVNVY